MPQCLLLGDHPVDFGTHRLAIAGLVRLTHFSGLRETARAGGRQLQVLLDAQVR